MREYREQLGKGNPANTHEFRVWYLDSSGKAKCHIIYGQNVQILDRIDGKLIGRSDAGIIIEFSGTKP